MTSSNTLVDQFSRTISYLRLSLTDRCNLRCQYCMPCDNSDQSNSQHSFRNISSIELLSYEELLRVVSITANLGMKKIRLTGGEPLIRKGVMGFIHNLSLIKGLEQIRLTTNGVLLEERAEELFDIGVRNLNISLDTLNPEKFEKITGRNFFEKVIKGIDKALHTGFKIKLNIVAMRGVNDDEFVNFAQLALQKPLQVRFIEFMPVGKGSIWDKDQYIKTEDIQKIIANVGSLEPYSGSKFEGPARVFSITNKSGKSGQVGFISPISHHFCDQCNRLRLTSEGKLRSCLLHDGESDLKQIIRNGCTDKEIEEVFRSAILNKPKGHSLNSDQADDRPACQVQMSRIGG